MNLLSNQTHPIFSDANIDIPQKSLQPAFRNSFSRETRCLKDDFSKDIKKVSTEKAAKSESNSKLEYAQVFNHFFDGKIVKLSVHDYNPFTV